MSVKKEFGEQDKQKAKDLRKRIKAVARLLEKAYPEPECALNFSNPFEILVATVLSAQCTDKKVNTVTPALFRKYPDAHKLALARLPSVEKIIRSLGLFRNKAKNLIALSKKLVSVYDGAVPETIEQLADLPGVGRKTANCVLVNAFELPGIMVDTHCIRLCNRLGFYEGKDAVKIEITIKGLLPEKLWSGFSHRIILHGREVCHARNPDCGSCVLSKHCEYYKNG